MGTGTLTLVTSHAKNWVLGTAAEAPAGKDYSDIRDENPVFTAYPEHVGGTIVDGQYQEDGTLFTDTVNLSSRDLSALKEGFTLITIGDSSTSQMNFGDAFETEVVKFTDVERIRDSAFHDDLLLISEKIFIEGDVQTVRKNESDPQVTLQVQTDRLHIKSKNINVPLGKRDSGITGDLLDLDGIQNRLIIDDELDDVLIEVGGHHSGDSAPIEIGIEAHCFEHAVSYRTANCRPK